MRAQTSKYAHELAGMLLAPAPGMPYDAQALARAELEKLRRDLRRAQAAGGRDAMTLAHLAALETIASGALDAKTVVPVAAAAGS